jgi:hypothetical protein
MDKDTCVKLLQLMDAVWNPYDPLSTLLSTRGIVEAISRTVPAFQRVLYVGSEAERLV